MKRFRIGFGWGVLATLAMSVVMIGGMLTGISPMPVPIPAAIVAKLTSGALPKPALMAVAAALHLGYGGSWGGVLASLRGRASLARGVMLGAALWVLMGAAVLPWLGWGPFGTGRTPRIAAATLVLHLIYGVTLGWGLGRGSGASTTAVQGRH